MEQSLTIFISSVIETFRAERQALKSMLEEIPLNRPWLFEHTPASSEPLATSYLQRVKECDIFILLLGRDITGPVAREWETATECRKPRLVFLQKIQRSPEADEFVRQTDVKWVAFSDLESLKAEVKKALLQELIRNHKTYQIQKSERGELSKKLETLHQTQKTQGDTITISVQSTGGGPIAAGKNIRQNVSGGGQVRATNPFWSAGLRVISAIIFLLSVALAWSSRAEKPTWVNYFPGTALSENNIIFALGLFALSAFLFFYARLIGKKK